MAYLIKADYARLISLNLLDEILDQAVDTSGVTADQCLDNAYQMAQAEVKAYLNKLFDMTAELAKANTDATRNTNVIRAIIHITLYNLHFTINPHDIPEMRQNIYKALTGNNGELSQVRDGRLDWELTPRDADVTEGMQRTNIGSAKKFISKDFTDPIFFDGTNT